MSYLRDNSNLVKGDELWLFLGTEEGVEVPTCFSQQHSLTRSLSTTSVSSKDHGNTSYVVPGEGSWTCSTEALMSMNTEDENSMAFVEVMDAYDNGDLVYVKFGKLSNYVEKGIVDVNTTDLPADTREGWKLDTPYWKGKGYITSLQASGGHGDSATFSIEITGIGPLTKVTEPEPGPTPTPGEYDITYDFDISLRDGAYGHGTLSPGATSADEGDRITIECKNGLQTSDVYIVSNDAELLSNQNGWEFVMPDSDVDIEAKRKYGMVINDYQDKFSFSYNFNSTVSSWYDIAGSTVKIYAYQPSFLSTYVMGSNPLLSWDTGSDSNGSYFTTSMPNLYTMNPQPEYTYLYITPYQDA